LPEEFFTGMGGVAKIGTSFACEHAVRPGMRNHSGYFMGTTVAADIATIARIDAVPAILQVICETTGMRFAAAQAVHEVSVTRATAASWT
jgi:hypothetical protein